MSSIRDKFEESLKEYDGDKSELLQVDKFADRLKEELPRYFLDWMNPELTGEPAIKPISKIDIEVDSGGYVYACLYSEKDI